MDKKVSLKEEIGYFVTEKDYSKIISSCYSGEIVTKKDEKYLLVYFPKLNEKESYLFLKTLKELKQSKIKINSKADIYFFLKNFCLENLILLNKEQREKILTLLEWESIGESALYLLLRDPDFEEIVINGINKPIMVYHRAFGWLETNCYFCSEEKVKTIINKMAAPIGRQISFHSPILNAVIDNGSRVNASMNPIAFSGINVTIRKFKEKPMTPVSIVNSKTISREAMAFLWLTMQASCSVMVCGNTGSGKTTTLNALFCFLPKNERIIVAEETPELSLPQEHKVKLNTSTQLGIGLKELIENTFRMRPDRVIVGEIRNNEEASAFVNTMLAGQAKGSYATFHAESAQEALERLQTFGIEKSSLASIDLIVLQKRIGKINLRNNSRQEERKVVEICEIIKKEKEIELNKLFSYDFQQNLIVKVNDSVRVKEKIKLAFNLSSKEFEKVLLEKEELLGKISENVSFMEFFELAEKE